MATPDEQMNAYLNIIEKAVKGKDMRKALHDSIEKTYNDSYTWADETLGNANQALAKATHAEEIATGMASEIEDVEELGEEVTSMYGELTGRINNIIAHNNDTEGNTELIDIRTDYQGYTSVAAGAGVRRQQQIMNQRMNQIVREFPTTQVSASVPLTIVKTSIWTNPDATEAYAGDVITFSNDELEDAAQIAIVFKKHKSDVEDTIELAFTMPSANGEVDTIATLPVLGSNGTDNISRLIAITNSTIGIGNCYKLHFNSPFSLSGTDLSISDTSSTTVQDNECLIPVAIYSVKFSVVATLSVAKDSEITDARVGIDGTTYDSLGEAIRTQIAQYTAEGILDALSDSY